MPCHLDRLLAAPSSGSFEKSEVLKTCSDELESFLESPADLVCFCFDPPATVRVETVILDRSVEKIPNLCSLPLPGRCFVDTPQTTAAAMRAELRTWTANELASFLRQSAGETDRLHPAWNFLALTGCRRGEALGLRWADVDLQAATASIRQTLIVVNHKPLFGTPKTGAGTRVIDLDKATVTSLRSLRKRQLEERLAMGDGWPDHNLVFTHADGRLLHPERFSREFTRRIKRYDLPVIRLHDLRHTWATLALKAGIHPKVVQERLGHASINVTLDTYSHVTAGMQRNAAETIASMISGRA
jgi:integrase